MSLKRETQGKRIRVDALFRACKNGDLETLQKIELKMDSYFRMVCF